MRVILLLGVASALLATCANSPVAAEETILQNDGYIDGQAVGFQAGFAEGEIGASRLVPASSSTWRVNRVVFLFGGAMSTQTITLHIWDDAAGTNAPGDPLFVGDYSVLGSNTELQVVDLTADDVTVTGPFRVGIEFQHDGPPSIARDGDGTIVSANNFIYSSEWFLSSLFGVSGDWIIRAVVEEQSTAVGDELPSDWSFAPAGANPSRGGPSFHFGLPSAAQIDLSIFDVGGRKVATLASGRFEAGHHSVAWSAQRGTVPVAGVYFARLSADERHITRRVVLLR